MVLLHSSVAIIFCKRIESVAKPGTSILIFLAPNTPAQTPVHINEAVTDDVVDELMTFKTADARGLPVEVVRRKFFACEKVTLLDVSSPRPFLHNLTCQLHFLFRPHALAPLCTSPLC